MSVAMNNTEILVNKENHYVFKKQYS